MTAEVTIDKITHGFGSFVALNDVNLTIGAGEFAVLLGPSGCGKTTLLSIIGGFLRPSQGRILIGGNDVTHLPPSARPTTTMFQDYALFPHMSLLDNVGFGLRMRGLSRPERNARAKDLLALVGLPEAGSRKPHELSGGQRQRVALARALAVEPDVLLLDEPLGALDLKLRRQMQDELKAIQRRVGTTFIHVTHDQEEAMAIADVIIVMNGGEVQHAGVPEEIYLRPNNHFTAAFMGEANFIRGEVLQVSSRSIDVQTAFGVHRFPLSVLNGAAIDVGQTVEICFRPEHVRLGVNAGKSCDFGQVEVTDVAFFGTHHRCLLQLAALGDQTITAHLPQTLDLKDRGKLRLLVKPSDAILLRSDGLVR